MDTESELIFDRMHLHRLIQQHPDWTNQHCADELGKSEGWVRKWRYRFANTTQPTFTMYLSQSRAPQTIWRATDPAVQAVIAQMRVELSEQYHRKAGPKLILHELRKRQDLKDAGYYSPQSERTVAKILKA